MHIEMIKLFWLRNSLRQSELGGSKRFRWKLAISLIVKIAVSNVMNLLATTTLLNVIHDHTL